MQKKQGEIKTQTVSQPTHDSWVSFPFSIRKQSGVVTGCIQVKNMYIKKDILRRVPKPRVLIFRRASVLTTFAEVWEKISPLSWLQIWHFRGYFLGLAMTNLLTPAAHARASTVTVHVAVTILQCCSICNLYQLISFQLVIGLFQQVSLVLVSYKT